jgi:hypothetical protein
MRRQPHEPRPPKWTIHSTFVPRRDGPKRLGQVFQALLGSPSHQRFNFSNPNRSAHHEGRDLRQGLDRQAGAGPDD